MVSIKLQNRNNKRKNQFNIINRIEEQNYELWLEECENLIKKTALPGVMWPAFALLTYDTTALYRIQIQVNNENTDSGKPDYTQSHPGFDSTECV